MTTKRGAGDRLRAALWQATTRILAVPLMFAVVLIFLLLCAHRAMDDIARMENRRR